MAQSEFLHGYRERTASLVSSVTLVLFPRIIWKPISWSDSKLKIPVWEISARKVLTRQFQSETGTIRCSLNKENFLSRSRILVRETFDLAWRFAWRYSRLPVERRKRHKRTERKWKCHSTVLHNEPCHNLFWSQNTSLS